MKKSAVISCILAVLLIMAAQGCVRQSPALVGTPTPQFTPTPPPTPTPELIELPSDTDVDALGNRIDTDAHFMQYLTFRDVRVYEYNNDTLLDGVCDNDYPEPLTGAFEIVFSDANGVELARAPIALRSADGTFMPGETQLYAQIDTDMDVQLLPFEIQVTQRVWPVIQMTIVE